MTENTMPAAEAMVVGSEEITTYELAFHVLPTVAEGEVDHVVSAVKAHITNAGGTVVDEESPERVELAYEVVKSLEGRNRKFKSAYFGWVRFTIAPEAVPTLTEELETVNEILRHLLIKLTREEAQHPFRFHEAMAAANLTVRNFDFDNLDAEEEGEEEVVDAEVAPVAEEAVDDTKEVA